MMRYNKLPSSKRLNKMFLYKDGKLYWRKAPAKRLNDGDRAGYKKKKSAANIGGYRAIRIGDKNYQEHRIVWKMLKGSNPKGEVDHINGNPSDNRIENLRVVSRSGNMRNSKRQSNNNSGHTGVCWDKNMNKWRAYIRKNKGKNEYLGFFINKKDAIAARKIAEKKYGYHPNHGRG